jgi:hypothetical protein
MNLAELELLVDAYEVGKRRGQTVRTESDAELERRAYEISNLKSRIEELETAVEERTTVLGATYRDATNLVNLMGATLMVSEADRMSLLIPVNRIRNLTKPFAEPHRIQRSIDNQNENNNTGDRAGSGHE